MIYLVTNNQEFTDNNLYKVISVEESLRLLNSFNIVGLDTETNGRDPHLCKLLCVQIGNKENQVVIDCSTIDIVLYKDFIENHYIIGHNLKFDLQFLYNHSIIPTKVYDTMIVEQLLYLGYPSGTISYSLKEVAYRYLKVIIDKSVRGEIIWRGLDNEVIKYAASDVIYLEDIMKLQLQECKNKECLVGAKLECDFVPSIAYLEWCGIKLDTAKWSNKMEKDKESLIIAKTKLDQFIIDRQEDFKEYVFTNLQGSLFDGFDLTPKCSINWSSSQQVTKIAKKLGFNTTVQDKKTGEDKDSVLEKTLKCQKGINDKFLDLYFKYQEYAKVVSSFGQGHLNAVNPITGRIHTVYKQLGASSGRMSCGSQQPNTDLAKYKHINPKDCTFPNIQQLPADDLTRSSFVAEEDNYFCSADFSAEESRLAADIYQDKEFLKEFLERTGDTHNMFAWAVFRKECQDLGCKDASEVKNKAPQWRKKVKAVEFAYLFGAAAHTISQSAGCTVEKAQEYINTLDKEFKGTAEFAKRGSKFVRENGYIVINKFTGHKIYWWDFQEWKKEQEYFTQEFWEDYKKYHKGTNDEVALKVKHHFQVASKWDRMARNAVTQGTGATILKLACIKLFNWILKNNQFNKVKLCALVHDEICCEFPKELSYFPKTLENLMKEAAATYCKSLPIPAEASVGDHWIH